MSTTTTTTTTALVHRDPAQASKLEQVSLGPLQPDEALVEICASGICHTDLSCMRGVLPAKFPCVFGHEGAGTIIRPPTNNPTSLHAGDKVLLSFASCGTCAPCATHLSAYCHSFLARNFGGTRPDGTTALTVADATVCHANFFGQSSFMRHAVVHRTSIVPVPADTDLALFAPLGCGLQTGAGCVLNTLNIPAGAHIAIFGCGTVGLAAVMAARLRGAVCIIAIDLQPARLALATQLGATHALDGRAPDLVPQIQSLCPPNGVEYAVDCTGSPRVVETMVECLGTRGKAASVGAPAPGSRAGVEVLTHIMLGRSYVGCSEGDAYPQEFIPYLMEQYRAGKFPFDKLVRFYDVHDFAQAFEDMQAGLTVKPVLRWDSV